MHAHSHLRLTTLVACALVLAFAGQGRCESKHFQSSQRNFEELAAQAAILSAEMDSSWEKNACNYYAATAVTYAVRSHALAQLADVAAHLRQPEDQALLRRKMAETQVYVSRYTGDDLKVLEDIAAGNKNARIKDLGLRLINVLRVFERNASALTRN
ncbi:MAG: hypothetical protein ACLGSA_08675 [Acidobacteriota bacterium]